MNIDVKFKSNNIDNFKKASDDQIEMALIGIGAEAEGFAKQLCRVDTGRLRNSITFATKTEQGEANTMTGESASEEEYKMNAAPEKGSVYIGTNVTYAGIHERGSSTIKPKPYLKPALANHKDRWKELTEAALKA